MSPRYTRALGRWQPSVPISSLPLPASFGLHMMICHPGDPFWAGETWGNLGKPEARCLSRKTPDVPEILKTGTIPRGLVLTAGLSSDTPRRHRTSPLSLTAHSAILCPLPLASALSGMMDTSLRAMGATSSHGPLVTSLHFLFGGNSVGRGSRCDRKPRDCSPRLLTQLSSACGS